MKDFDENVTKTSDGRADEAYDDYGVYGDEAAQQSEAIGAEDGIYDGDFGGDDYDESEEEVYDEADDEQYYDERLSQVLDELAQLKRELASPAVYQRTAYANPSAAQPVMVPLAQNGGNEVVMYNEISRLRDELNKTQNNQNLQTELSRLKEDMEKEKRKNEAALLAEMKRLNQKVELLENKKESLRVSGAKTSAGVSGGDFAKLIAANEAVLRSMRDSDARVAAQLDALKTRFEAFGSLEELNRNVVSVDQGLKALEEKGGSEESKQVFSQLKALEEELAGGLGASETDKRILSLLSGLSTGQASGADLTEVMRAIYALRAQIGSADPAQRAHVASALKTYEKLSQLKTAVEETADLKEKLLCLDGFVNGLDGAAVGRDVADAVFRLAEECLRMPLTRVSMGRFCEFAHATGKDLVSEKKKAAAETYFSLLDRLETEDIFDAADLPDALADALDGLCAAECKDGERFARIRELGAALPLADEADRMVSRQIVRDRLAALTALKLGDVVSFRPELSVACFDQTAGRAEKAALCDKIEELKSMLSDLRLDAFAVSSGAAASGVVPAEISALRERPANDGNPKSETGAQGVTLILDELNSIKEKLSAGDEYDMMAEILSLREDVKASRIVNTNDVSIELEGIKGDIREIKTGLGDLKALPKAAPQTLGQSDENAPTSDEVNLLLSEIVSLRDEIQAYKDDVTNLLAAQNSEEAPVAAPEEDENVTLILDELTGMRAQLEGLTAEYQGELTAGTALLRENVSEIKDMIARRTTLVEGDSGQTVPGELNVVLDEIINLKNGLDAYAGKLDRLAEFQPAAVPVSASDAIGIDAALSALTGQVAEIRREQILGREAEPADREALLSIRSDLKRLTEQTKPRKVEASAPDPTGEAIGALCDEVRLLREEVEQLKVAAAENAAGKEVVETVDAIRADVRGMREEPDLSVINEMLALREEFQAFKDEANKARTEPSEDGREETLKEIRALRDQIFAISMANVSDGTSGEAVYESYNNILLDEISALRDELALLKRADETKALAAELAEVKELLTNLAVDEKEARSEQSARLKQELDRLRARQKASSDDAVLEELKGLRREFANRQGADEAPANGTLKAARQGGARGKTEKPEENSDDPTDGDGQNEYVHREIARLKTEIDQIVGKEQTAGAQTDLLRSINDLKEELNKLAAYVDKESD